MKCIWRIHKRSLLVSTDQKKLWGQGISGLQGYGRFFFFKNSFLFSSLMNIYYFYNSGKGNYTKSIWNTRIHSRRTKFMLPQILVAFFLEMHISVRRGKRTVHPISISVENQWKRHSAIGGVVNEWMQPYNFSGLCKLGREKQFVHVDKLLYFLGIL